MLAPVRATFALPADLPIETALLVESFAAVLNAVERIAEAFATARTPACIKAMVDVRP